MKRFILGVPFLFAGANLLAQRNSPSPRYSPTGQDAAVAGIGVACCFLYCLLIAASVGAWIFTALWIMKDAKSRNSENAQLVTILGWIPPTWVIGLIVHLVTRPKGNLVPCPHCAKKRLEGLATCPHCGQP